ncbi:uncharacterized protein [Narcine bancroftii]|uniref:uncharacterized protein isoform X2 n=1 Tax=Narcine bancroftii TaxID=1343680 RepID=UPI003831110C
MVTQDLEDHSKIPPALQKLRSRESKAMGVTLVMLGLLLLMALIPIVNVTPSTLVRSGMPIITALLFMLLGTLAILIEQQPRQCLVKVTEVTLALTAILGAVEMVVLLVDISRIRGVHTSCEIGLHFLMCYQRIMPQKVLMTTIPVVYLMILTGTFLCIALSIILHEFFQTWTPEMTGSSPAEASQQLVETGTSPNEVPAPIEGVLQNQKSVRPPKTSMLVQKFLEIHPKILGVILLTTAHGIILLAMPDMVVARIEYGHLGVIWWTFVQCIISGIFSILAEGNPNIPMLRACLALNIISAIAASVGSLSYFDFASHIVICISVKCETLVVNPVTIQETREDPTSTE